jgi:hypothetical protein
MAQEPLNPGIHRQPSVEALRRAMLEIAESAILGCLEPRPISSWYEDELPRVRRAIVHARDGRLARFPRQVNRNAFVLGCLDYASGQTLEHLIIGYGFRHGSTTKSKACITWSETPAPWVLLPPWHTPCGTITASMQTTNC